MLGIFNNIEQELQNSLNELAKRNKDEGFSEHVKKLIKQHYTSFPLDFSYIGLETLGKGQQEETFSNVLHVLKWVIYKQYRSLPKIKNDEALCTKKRQLKY
jgi:hypothetical protein